MALREHGIAEGAHSERLRDLARRCRDLAELTVVPEVVRELERIARALDDEAGLDERE
ncbi:MAG TPA: hypothetical protein VGR79_01355 [Stellaceae bacterium]|nr:hypothetical protein [Stellaceae bacterium]